MFDRFKILHGLPKEGQKITFIQPTHSWFINVREDSEKLIRGQQYTVRKTELNSSSTYVWLEEFPNIFDPNDPNDGRDQPFFNMASFEWEPPEINLQDLIGMNPMDVCRLTHPPYKYGIEFDGKLKYEGSPILVIEYKKTESMDNRWNNTEITNAYFKKDDN
jgi:hypothetical protein